MEMTALVVLSLAAQRLHTIWHTSQFTAPFVTGWCARTKDDLTKPKALRLLAFHLWCDFCTSISAGALATAGAAALGLISWPASPLYALAAGVGIEVMQRVFNALAQVATAPRLISQMLYTSMDQVAQTNRALAYAMTEPAPKPPSDAPGTPA